MLGAAASRRLLSSVSTHALKNSADVVVVGAGIMGLSVAYQLRRRDSKAKIVVLEQADGLGVGSSGYSTGFLRAYYNLDNTMKLALDGINAYKNWGAFLRNDSVKATFRRTDALWMLGSTKDHDLAMQGRMRAFGVESDVFDSDDIARKFPLLSREPYPLLDEHFNEIPQSIPPLSAVYEHGCGYVDPTACLQDLLSACRRDGIDVRFRSKALGFIDESGRVGGVTLYGGGQVRSRVVVNCAGPWFQKLNDTIGVKLSTKSVPIRIQVAHKCGFPA